MKSKRQHVVYIIGYLPHVWYVLRKSIRFQNYLETHFITTTRRCGTKKSQNNGLFGLLYIHMLFLI